MTTEVQTVNGTPSQALVAADIAHVLWAVNLGCLGFHVWPFRADVADEGHVDELRLDLDPQPGSASPRRCRPLSSCVTCWPSWASPPTPRPPPAAASTSTCASSPAGTHQVRAAAVACPRAGAPPARPAHRRLVEGGAGRPDLRRLQPERPTRPSSAPGPCTRVGARVDPGHLGRAARGPARRPDHRHRPRRVARDGDPWGDSRRRPHRSSRCWPCRARRGGRPDGRPVAPVYPRCQRAAPGGASRARDP